MQCTSLASSFITIIIISPPLLSFIGASRLVSVKAEFLLFFFALFALFLPGTFFLFLLSRPIIGGVGVFENGVCVGTEEERSSLLSLSLSLSPFLQL